MPPLSTAVAADRGSPLWSEFSDAVHEVYGPPCEAVHYFPEGQKRGLNSR